MAKIHYSSYAIFLLTVLVLQNKCSAHPFNIVPHIPKSVKMAKITTYAASKDSSLSTPGSVGNENTPTKIEKEPSVSSTILL